MQLMPHVKNAVAAFRSSLRLRALGLGVGAGIEHEQILHKFNMCRVMNWRVCIGTWHRAWSLCACRG